MLSRFVEAPVAPSAIVTVPEDIEWLADVVLVKVANVARPAMLAAAPRTAMVAISLVAVEVRLPLRARRRKDFIVTRISLWGYSPVTPSAGGDLSLMGASVYARFGACCDRPSTDTECSPELLARCLPPDLRRQQDQLLEDVSAGSWPVASRR